MKTVTNGPRFEDGTDVGSGVGAAGGFFDGNKVGIEVVGSSCGVFVGLFDGEEVGLAVTGAGVGGRVGAGAGFFEGDAVGALVVDVSVGFFDGDTVKLAVGGAVGLSLGDTVEPLPVGAGRFGVPDGPLEANTVGACVAGGAVG
jgi:hypothetical protein